MPDEFEQAYKRVHAPATPTPEPDDEFKQAYDRVVGPAAGKGPMAEKFYQGAKKLIKQPDRIGGGAAKGFMFTAEAVLRLPALVTSQAKLASSYVQAEQIHATKDPTEQKLLRQGMKRSEKAYDLLIKDLSETANWHHELQKGIIKNHPEWESEPPTGTLDLIMSPDKLAVALAEAVPLLVTAGFLTAGGQPHAAATLMFAAESNQAYHEAKQDGQSDDTAYDAATVYGLVAAGLEYMQLKGIMKIGKGAYNTILNRTVQKVAKNGTKNITKVIIIQAAKEASEEASQGQWGEITAKLIYGKKQEGGTLAWIDRRAQEAYVGFMMGVIPGVGGVAGGKAVSKFDGMQQPGKDFSVKDRPTPEELPSGVLKQRADVLKGAYYKGFDSSISIVDNVLATANERGGGLTAEETGIIDIESRRMVDFLRQNGELTRNNPELLAEVGEIVQLIPEYTRAVAAFEKNPSTRNRVKAKKISQQIGKLGKGYEQHLIDTLAALRRNPEYVNEPGITVTLPDGSQRQRYEPTSTVPAETMADLNKRGDEKAFEEAQSTDDVPKPLQQTEEGTTPSKSPYTLVETQSGMEIHDKQTGRIIEHFDNFDKNSDRKAVKRFKEMNSNPEKAAKYDKSTNGQKAQITILGKRLGLIDEKGKVKSAFRRFIKSTTGKTSRRALTYGEAEKMITAMEKHQPTFREGDKVTPSGFDTVGEVIHVNPKRGLATVQFKNRITGDTSSRIFNMRELAFIGEVQVATEELIETIRQSQKIQTPKDEVFGQKENRLLKKHWQKIKRYATGWHHSLIRVNRMTEWLDGHEKGANWHHIFLPTYQASLEADDAINQRSGDLQEFMLEKFGPKGVEQMMTGKRTPVSDPMFKDKISLSPSERIGYYVLSKNKDGLRRLKQGNLGSFGNKEAALKAILDSVTEQERQLGDWALEQLQAQTPRANQAAIMALGRELTPADNYFPLYAPAETRSMEQQVDFLTELEQKASAPGVSMEIAETKERVPTATGPVETNFFRSYLHNMARVEQFIHMAPAVNEVQNLLNNKEYRHVINKATNGYGVKIIQDWVRDTTRGKSTEINNWMGKTLIGLRTNGMLYAIGYNIPSVMRQPLSFGNAIAIDPLMMKYVPANWMKNGEDWGNYRIMDNEVMGKSIMMRNRNFDRVQSSLNSLPAMEKRIMGKKTYSQKAIGWIRWMDRHTAVLVWKSLYDCAIERNMSEEQAIAFADDGTAKTQPMGHARDLPAFFRGGPLEKLFSTFQNQVNNNYNFWTHDIVGELKAGKISKKTAAYRVMFSYVIPALLFGMIGRGGPPDEWKDIATDLALYPLGSLFLVGRMIYNATQGFAGGGTSVAEIGINELEKTIAAGFRGDIGKVAKHGIKATGALTGRIPAQAIRTVEGAYDLSQNETDDWRRLIYSEWSLSRGDSGSALIGQRGGRKRTTVTRKLRRRSQ